jgi:hypothetical protein
MGSLLPYWRSGSLLEEFLPLGNTNPHKEGLSKDRLGAD